MTRLLAVAELRLREGFAAGLAWLVPLAFVVGFGAAHWAEGADAAGRAAHADRVALWAAWGLAFVVAAVVPAMGLPSDIRTGAAQTLLASPASRFEIVLGGVLGYGALSTLLLVATAEASVLGMQLAGVGPAERDPVRPATAAEIVDPNFGDAFLVDAQAPTAAFRFRVPSGLAPGEALRVRLAPRAPRIETGVIQRSTVAMLSVHRPGGTESDARQVEFVAGTAFTVHLPLGALRTGDGAELTFRRASGSWKLEFAPGSVEIGGGRRLFAWSVLTASACAVPLLLLLAAVGALAAARFAAPTAIVFAVAAFLVFVGRSFIVDGASYIVNAAETELAHPREGAPPEFSPTRVALAKGAIAAFEFVPRFDAFDRTDDLVERRATTAGDLGRAAAEGLPAAVVLTAAAWLLFRRREIQPG